MFTVTAGELIAYVNLLGHTTLHTLARDHMFSVEPRDADSFIITPAEGRTGAAGQPHINTRPYIEAFCTEFSRTNSWRTVDYRNLSPQTPNQSYLLALTSHYLQSQGHVIRV